MRSKPVPAAGLHAITLILSAAILATAQNWPQWRGPNRDGVLDALPGDWPAHLSRRWRLEVGLGHSSPVTQGSSVWLLTRQAEDEVVWRIRLDSGQVVWRERYTAPYDVNPAARAHGKGPKSTPAWSDGRLFTLGIGGILSCFDAQSGKLIWRKDFARQYAASSPLYGAAMSPLPAGDLLIAHVGGHDSGALVAFEAATGTVRWSWAEDGPGYSSPVLAELGGVRQVITQTQRHIASVELDTGKLLWKVPFTTPYDQNSVTPVVYRDLVILSGHRQRTFAVRPVRQGGAWRPEEVWSSSETSMYMSSPVLSGHLLFGLTERDRGNLFCLDARTGRLVWSGAGRYGDNAALILAGDRLAVLTTGSELLIGPAGSRPFEPTARYQVASSPTWAHPVLTSQGVLIKDETTLQLWSR